MKNLKFLLAFLFVLTFSHSAFSQIKYKGTVVDIVDGKTVVIEIPPTRNKLTAELQDIEVPEPEQELHATVKEHLQKLLLGKEVEFVAAQMKPTKTIGQIFAGGIDISMQMLRDGAAWYSTAATEKQGFIVNRNQNYQNAEALAKQEQRGVWSIRSLKPAWEFRAEKEAARQKIIEAENQRKSEVEQSFTSNSRTKIDERIAARIASQKIGVEIWDDSLAGKNSSNLLSKYNPATKIGYISTPMMYGNVSDGKTSHEVLVSVAYKYTGQPMPKGGKTLILSVGNASQIKNFLHNNSVMIYFDKNSKVPLSRFEIDSANKSEVFFYQVSRAALEKLVVSDEAFISVGRYKKPLDESILSYIRKVLELTK